MLNQQRLMKCSARCDYCRQWYKQVPECTDTTYKFRLLQKEWTRHKRRKLLRGCSVLLCAALSMFAGCCCAPGPVHVKDLGVCAVTISGCSFHGDSSCRRDQTFAHSYMPAPQPLSVHYGLWTPEQSCPCKMKDRFHPCGAIQPSHACNMQQY